MSDSKAGIMQMLDGALWASLALLAFSVLLYFGSGFKQEYLVSVVKDNYYRTEVGDVITVHSKNPINRTDMLELPVKSVSEIVDWASQVAVQLFTVDFFNIDSQINELRPFFTEPGWVAMNAALRDSGWVASLVEKKLSVSAVLKGSPSVLRHGMVNGAYAWVINFPLLVTYESASEQRKETRVFTLTVTRVDADYSKGQAGIAIDSFVTGGGNL
jgi:intracellular multiplication protein IcmL